MIRVYELNDDNEFTEVGTVEDGEITSGEETLTTIDSEQTWTTLTEQELADRFNGPRVMATIDDDTPADDDEPVEQQASFIHISELPVTPTQLDTLVDTKEWVRYQGPQGGEGWRNTETNQVVYNEDRLPDDADIVETPGQDTTLDTGVSPEMAGGFSAEDLDAPSDDQLPDVEISEVSPDEFTDSVSRLLEEDPEMGAFLSEHDPEEFEDYTLLSAEEGTAGVAVSPTGDIQNLHAGDDAPPGTGEKLLREAIENGGRTLDNYDTFLTRLYARNGFNEVSRMNFNPEFAPDEWNYDDYGHPDVVFMAYQPDETYEESEEYITADEWGETKERSLDMAAEDIGDPVTSELIHMAQDDYDDAAQVQRFIDDAVENNGEEYVAENIDRLLAGLKPVMNVPDKENLDIPDGE